MISETITLHFQDAEQQRRFHERLNTPELDADAIRAAAYEDAAKIADAYGQRAEMRADQHKNGEARNAALDKFEAALEIALDIRSRSKERQT